MSSASHDVSTVETSASQGPTNPDTKHTRAPKAPKWKPKERKPADKKATSQTGPVNIYVGGKGEDTAPKPAAAPPANKPVGPSLADKFRSMEQIIGTVTDLYLSTPIKIMGFTLPATVTDTPMPSWLPITYHFSYQTVVLKINGSSVPHVHVLRHEIRFGEPGLETVVDIEWELFVKCFNQSTVRDYETLINSIFMVVNRGLTADKASYDVNTKLEAIAALYLFRHPNLNTAYSVFLRVLSQYRPILPGVYALGGLNTPEFGEPPFEVHWKSERAPCAQHYVARLLDPEFEGIIQPFYIPARTKAEFIKGFAKRLKRPPRVPFTYRGITWDLERTREVCRDSADWILFNMMERARSVNPLAPDQIKAACLKHAQARFQAPADIADYVEGARVAIEESVDSPLFKRAVDLCVSIGVFDKKETYAKLAPIRYIMCPEIYARGFCHALLMNTQRALFGSDMQTHNPNCVKHMSEEERKVYVTELFGVQKVCNGDISSMEATVSKYHMDDIERRFFTTLCVDTERVKINALWDAYTQRMYNVHCKEYQFMLEPMRLSGQEHTSAGNFVINLTWIHSIVFMLTGKRIDTRRFQCLCEGDDSLFTSRIPLNDGTWYDVVAEDFNAAATALGTVLKLNVCDNVIDASFCGIALAPAVRTDPDGNKVPDDCLKVETYHTLAKCLWDVGYDRVTCKHDGEKVFARALSYLPRAVGNPELYEALFYLARKWEPKQSVKNTVHYRDILLHVFYKGEMEAVPDCQTTLDGFCEKFKLPKLEFPWFYKPAVLSVPGPNDFNMETVHITRAPNNGLVDTIKNWFSKIHPTRRVIEDTNDGLCLYHSVFTALKRNGQLPDDLEFDAWYEEHAIEDTPMPTRSQIPQLLEDGQYVDVVDRGERRRYTSEGVLGAEELIVAEPEPTYVEVSEGVFSNCDHAVVVGPREEAERPIGFIPFYLWPIVAAILCFVLYIVAWCQLWEVTLWGVPLYCWWRIGGQGWSKFAAWMGWGKDHDLPIPWRIIGTLAGVTLSYGLGLKILVVGLIAVAVYVVFRYTPWLWNLILMPVRLVIEGGSAALLALRRASPRAANLAASGLALAGLFSLVGYIFWTAFFF